MAEIRFEKNRMRAAAYDDMKEAGECVVEVGNGCWTIIHTGVDKAYGGQGIAGKLVQCVADEARREGLKVVASCSYAKAWFEKHEEYRDLLRD